MHFAFLMCAISKSPISIKGTFLVPAAFGSGGALCRQAQITWMMISISLNCVIQGLWEALKLVP